MSLKRKDSSANHTGMSQEFDRFDFFEDNVVGRRLVKPKKCDMAKIEHTTSKGFVLVVSRSSKEAKNTIETHTLQKSFFSVPADATKHAMKLVEEKIKTMEDNYKANGYDVERHEFDLPFGVGVIGGLTTGYCGSTPKAMKAEEVVKIVKEADEDDYEEEATKGKKRGRVGEDTEAKRAKKA